MNLHTPYERALGDGLFLRSLRLPDDVERLAELHSHIHGQSIGLMAQTLMVEHPYIRPEHWLYVEDQATRQIVAGLNLIPWAWRYGEVTLRSAEMAIVSTREAYRRRGLIRALNGRFEELMREGDYDLSHIQGIPYFYRQFGYEYAMPLEAWCRVELHNFKAPPDGSAYTFSPASEADIPTLMSLYDAAAERLEISAMRDEAIWRYLLGPSLQTDMAGHPWLIYGPNNTPAGYLRVMPVGFGEGLICGEASLLSADAALAALQWLVALARERSKPYVRLNLPKDHMLNQLALDYGAHDPGAYAWQIKLPNLPALLRKLAPTFERRLAESSLAGLSRDLHFDLYRSALFMRFVNGRLLAVEAVNPGAPGDVRMPPQLMTPLLFGWRSFGELSYIFPDALINAASRALVDVLFPRVESFIYSVY